MTAAWFPFCAIFIGAGIATMIQTVVGFGFSFAFVPVLLVLAPERLPQTPLLLLFPLTGFLAIAEAKSVCWRHDVSRLLVGRLLGTSLAALVLANVDPQSLQGLIGGTVALMALMSYLRVRIPLNGSSKVVFGCISGLTGTLAGLGGPPVALLYRARLAPESFRGTLSAVFVVGLLMSIAWLAAIGRITSEDLWLAGRLSPSLVIGGLLGLLVRRWGVVARALPTAIVLLSGCSAVVVLVRSSL